MLVGTASVKIMEANPKRIQYSIVNNGGAIIYLGANAGVTTDSGEPLGVGAMISDDKDREDVWAISSAPDQDIRVTEVLEA